ncbi:hypothetical protein FGO68_gene15531 [Halteria grandinella]|uniref:Uncharacterized protein n=1 Tax=Halteria grandinella TaxID=5974 RepID=A0A8J8T3Q7_HALGN|nr:hypothetical protein FGO68_gene15531 [Halteria grandinella]
MTQQSQNPRCLLSEESSATLALELLSDVVHRCECAGLSLGALINADGLLLGEFVLREAADALGEALLVDRHGQLDHHALHDHLFFALLAIASSSSTGRHLQNTCDQQIIYNNHCIPI